MKLFFWAISCLSFLTGCNKVLNNPYDDLKSDKVTLYSSFAERPKHLDPVSSYSENEARFTAQIYEPLVQYHYTKRPYQLSPLTSLRLPEELFYDSEHNLLPKTANSERVAYTTYEIEIKKNIFYQPHPCFAKRKDGRYFYHNVNAFDPIEVNELSDFSRTGTRELVASDYVYQIKRLVHPKLHSPIAGLMKKYIVGLSEFSEKLNEMQRKGIKIDLRKVDFLGAETNSRYKFRIRINGKYPQFKYWLAMSFFAPVPWEAEVFYGLPGLNEKNISLDWYPVGTGPYMLTENNPNRRMVLERNPEYPDEKFEQDSLTEFKKRGEQSQLKIIERALYTLEKEAIPEWTKFMQGYYDTSGILSDSFDQVIKITSRGDSQLTDDMKKKNINLIKAVKTSIAYMGFNMMDPVVGGYDDRAKYLRRAISIAIDFEEYLSIFANGRGVVAQGPIPPGIFGYRGGENNINDRVYEERLGKKRRKSIKEANRLMSLAGYEGGWDKSKGAPLTLFYDTVGGGASRKAMLNWYRKQFEKIGIQLVVRSTDYNRFQEKIRKGTAQIFSWGWNADYPDPENFLFLLYGPNAKSISQGENASNYQNKEYDELFRLMRVQKNSADRQRIIDEMVEILREDAPWIWGFHPTSYILHHDWLEGVMPNLMARNTLKYRRINNELRSQSRENWNNPSVWPLVVIFFAFISLLGLTAWIYRKRQLERVR